MGDNGNTIGNLRNFFVGCILFFMLCACAASGIRQSCTFYLGDFLLQLFRIVTRVEQRRRLLCVVFLDPSGGNPLIERFGGTGWPPPSMNSVPLRKPASLGDRLIQDGREKI